MDNEAIYDRELVTTAADEEDSRLLTAIAEGDRVAFRQFFNRFAPEVLALCKRILGTLEDAEDVTSEVFLEMWARRKEYDGRRSSPRTYLIMLARSRSIDRVRVKSKSKSCIDCVSVERTHTETPLAVASLTELRQAAVYAVNRLDSGQRDALSLAFFHGLSHQQIADRLHTPLGTVKSNIRKGLQRLQHILREFRSEAVG